MLYFILFIFSGLAYNDTKFLPVVFILFSIFFVRKFFELANYKFNPNKPGIFQWQSVDDVFLMVVD